MTVQLVETIEAFIVVDQEAGLSFYWKDGEIENLQSGTLDRPRVIYLEETAEDLRQAAYEKGHRKTIVMPVTLQMIHGTVRK